MKPRMRDLGPGSMRDRQPLGQGLPSFPSQKSSQAGHAWQETAALLRGSTSTHTPREGKEASAGLEDSLAHFF